MKIHIPGYLTQEKLQDALQQIVADSWLGHEVTVPGSRQRWDMALRVRRGVVVVEYDGDEHYRNTLRMKSDRDKDAVAAEHGFQVVRFPYWVQLTSETLTHFFGLTAEVEQDFPHGFITTRIFPASYCEMGVRRFQSELDALPRGVKRDVVLSLNSQITKHGVEYVLPTSLRFLADESQSSKSTSR